ncbi:hypothetical protein PilKf_02039 [Pillotina sp. SPG140]
MGTDLSGTELSETDLLGTDSGIRNQESGTRKPRKSALVLLFVTLVFCLTSNLSAQNHQKIIPIDSEIYTAIKSLYIAHGLALPSTAGPWSEDELLLMLSRLDQSKLKGSEQGVYDFAYNELTKDEYKTFRFTGAVTAQAFVHTNTEAFVSPDDNMLPINYMKPFANFNFDFRLSSNTYGYFELPISALMYGTDIPATSSTPAMIGSSRLGPNTVSFNVPFTGGSGDLNFNVPFRTFGAFGGHGWTVEVGRDRLSWGPGESGNFMVGDHIHYHNNAHATIYGQQFKWTYTISGFPHPQEYYDLTDPDNIKYTPTKDESIDTIEGLNLFIAHRLEWRILKNKMGFAFSEAIMYQSSNGQLSIETFLPTMLLHDLYRKSNQNSLLTLEVDFSPIPLLNLYGQLAVDEFHLPTEGNPGIQAGEDGLPDAYGFMVGAKTAFPLWNGMLSASAEFAFTDPYLYLHTNMADNLSTYVVANRYYGRVDKPNGYRYKEDYLGYRWGGDAMVFNVNGEYRNFGRWNVGVNFMAMIHGTHDKWTWLKDWVYSVDSDLPPHDYTTPTESHDQPNFADSEAQSRSGAYILTAFSLMGSWQFLPHCALFGQVDLIGVSNKNFSGNTESDIQLSLGLTYTF